MKPPVGLLLFLAVLFTMHLAFGQVPPLAWVQRYPEGGYVVNAFVAADRDNNVVVVDAVNGLTTIKYSNNGVPLWTNYFNGGFSGFWPLAMTVDGSNNIVVGGGCQVSSGYNCFTIEYASTGQPRWTNYYAGNSPSTTLNLVQALTVDSSNNVVITGSSGVYPSFFNCFTIKYSLTGAPLWTNNVSVPSSWCSGYAVATDSNNNVFVGGVVSYNGAVVKYSSDGVPVWTNISPISVSDSAGVSFQILAIDGSNNVFSDSFQPYYTSNDGMNHYYVTKYSNSGTIVWNQDFGYTNGDGYLAPFYPPSLAVDKNGNAFLVGSGRSTDSFVIKYSSAGLPLWTNIYPGTYQLENSHPLIVDRGNNLIISGYANNGATGNDYLTVKYSGTGVPVWTNLYDGSGNGDDQATSLSLDQVGNVYVTGSSWNGANYDLTTIKYLVSQLPIPLFLQKKNNQMVLSWSNAAFSLQSAPTPNGTFTNLTGVTSPYTNPITGSQRFFRLIAN